MEAEAPCSWCGLTGGAFHGEGVCNGLIHEFTASSAVRCRHPLTLPVRVTTTPELVTCPMCMTEPTRGR